METPVIGKRVHYKGIGATIVDFDEVIVVLAWYNSTGRAIELEVEHGEFEAIV